MNPDRPNPESRRRASRTIRFANDPGLTFVNYDPGDPSGSGYRPEARLHNAHRRSSRTSRNLRDNPTSTRASQSQPELAVIRPASLLDPVSTYARDPFSQDVLIPLPNLEAIWRSGFPHSFYLPQTIEMTPGIPNPADSFLNAARSSPDIFRTIVVQSVVTGEVGRGTQAAEAVFRNQALILRDFRRLIETYDTPTKTLSKEQFEHIFATALSMSGLGFDQQAGYDAILFVNSLFMTTPHNQTLPQTPVTDWMRLLLPRPGPAFNRSRAFQIDMLRKINLSFAFLERMRDDTNNKFPDHVSQYITPGSPIHTLVTTKLPNEILHEPYPEFYPTCQHRLLSALYKYLEYISNMQPSESNLLLSRLENSASICLHYPPEQCITLFVWCLTFMTEHTSLNNDAEEQLFAWAMKDLLHLHQISLADDMVSWLLGRCSAAGDSQISRTNFTELRDRMRQHYDTAETPERETWGGVED